MSFAFITTIVTFLSGLLSAFTKYLPAKTSAEKQQDDQKKVADEEKQVEQGGRPSW